MELVYTKDGKAIMTAIQVARATKMTVGGYMAVLTHHVKKGRLEMLVIDGKKWFTLGSVEKYQRALIEKSKAKTEQLERGIRSVAP